MKPRVLASCGLFLFYVINRAGESYLLLLKTRHSGTEDTTSLVCDDWACRDLKSSLLEAVLQWLAGSVEEEEVGLGK